MKIGISIKLWLVIILIVFIMSIFNYWTTIIIYEHFYVQESGKQLEEKGAKIAEWYQGGAITEEFREKVRIANELSSEEIILSDKPEILGQCLPVVHKGSDSPFTPDQLEKLYKGEFVTITGEHTECKKDLIAVAVPLIDQNANKNQFIGAIFVYKPLSTVYEAIDEVKTNSIIFATFFLLTGIFIGKIITNKITARLRQMEEVAFKMMEGDFNTKVDVYPRDELGRLGITINHLSSSLNKTIGLLSKEKKQLSQILDGIRDGVITIDKNGELILCNCSSVNLLNKIGLTKEEFLQLNIIQDSLIKVGQKKNIVVEEIEFKNKLFMLYFAPLIEDDQFWGTVLVIHDLTEERRREKDAREFLAIVSHELRTPLSYIRGYTEAFIDGVAGSKEIQDRYLKTIHNETLRMERLVHDLLDLAQLEKGTYPIKREDIILEHIVDQIVDRYSPVYKDKGVNLNYNNYSDKPLLMSGDRDRIIQIMVNLLENSLRHTPEGGKVVIETFTINDELVLQVSDTGEGIEKEYLDRIGEKFLRVDKARSRKSGGTGLGLAIVSQIIERLGGRLKVESVVGEGTSFRIYFPSLIK